MGDRLLLFVYCGSFGVEAMGRLDFRERLFVDGLDDQPITFLALREPQAEVIWFKSFEEYEVWERLGEYGLPFGVEELVQGFSGFPPRAQELEMAIDVLEEGIMPLAGDLPRGSSLVCLLSDSMKQLFMQDVMGRGKDVNEKGLVLRLEDVEDIFVRLAEVAQGGAVSASGLPRDVVFMVTVLLLREFMHHLGFEEVGLLVQGENGFRQK